LATKKTIGKKGKPVKDIRSQLSGYSISEILECFDNNYGNFLKYVRDLSDYPISNVGTLIEKAKRYSKYEQYFSAGISNMESGFSVPITEIPNGLLKLCRTYQFKLTKSLYDCYVEDPDFFTVAFKEDFTSLSPKDILDLLTTGASRNWRGDWQPTYFHKLHNDHNYNVKSLLIYFDNLYTYEALDDVWSIAREFIDYVNMMSKISPKYDKYPKNFLTSHKIATRNYNRLKEKFAEEDFKKCIDTSLEYTYGGFKVIYPKSTQDIKDEAVQQNHCVASYIQSVIDGKCHILFMRKSNEIDKSLITMEVREHRVVQARGKFNRDPTREEQDIIDKYNNKIERMDIAC